MEILEKRRRRREGVINMAREWALKLDFKASAVLIGSYARGDFNLWSDIDIILISNQLSGNPLERLKRIDFPPGFQVIPLTPEEFLKLVRSRDILAKETIEHGVCLRDDYDIIKKLKDRVK